MKKQNCKLENKKHQFNFFALEVDEGTFTMAKCTVCGFEQALDFKHNGTSWDHDEITDVLKSRINGELIQ